jgi:hypothetical protein
VADEAQRQAAEASLHAIERRVGQVSTEVVVGSRFYVAEDYHQKYRLRSDRLLIGEFAEVYPDPADFRESTAAARVNGYLDGYGTRVELEAEIDGLGLSVAGNARLRAVVSERRRLREVG